MVMMTGKEALMELLSNEGVEYVFGIPGATEALFMYALEDHPEIKYILGLHEVVSLGMAEGYSRTSGKVGVVNLHTGPGVAAAMPMLSNAYQGGVPLHLIHHPLPDCVLTRRLSTERWSYWSKSKNQPLLWKAG